MIQRYSIIAFVTLLALYLLSCSTSSELDELTATWNAHGLDSIAVHSIHQRHGSLYAGTDKGLFRSADNGENWKGPALNVDSLKYIKLILDNQQAIVAVVRYEDYSSFDYNDKALFKSVDNGKTWQAIDANAENWSDGFYLLDVVKQTENLDTLLGYTGAVYRSTDGGTNWRAVHAKVGFVDFLKVSRDHPEHILIGGTKPILWPYFAKSEDGGETWTDLSQHISFNADATATAAAVSPRNPDVGLVGFISSGPAIRKTQDGGQTWRTVLEDYRVYALQNSLRTSNRVYASGNHPSSKPTVVVSDNYGNNWTTFVHEEGPERMWVNDMTVAEIDGQEVVFLGTTKGVYSFRLEE